MSKHCRHCGEDIGIDNNVIEIHRKDSLQFGETLRTVYEPWVFHVGCWSQVAGENYVPMEPKPKPKFPTPGTFIDQIDANIPPPRSHHPNQDRLDAMAFGMKALFGKKK